MILRRPDQDPLNADASFGARAAFPVFLESQQCTDPPYLAIFQSEHSKLAGHIATMIEPGLFGELPAEVIQAIAEHDYGWRESDARQIANIDRQRLRPFPLLTADESMPSWEESIRCGGESSRLGGVLISRHFCALAMQDPARRWFAEKETQRRDGIERELGLRDQDIDRWTAAIGFCDLVSLYLCSGVRESAEFPLAHPALASARRAPKVRLDWRDGKVRFAPPIVRSGVTSPIEALERFTVGSEVRAKSLRWEML